MNLKKNQLLSFSISEMMFHLFTPFILKINPSIYMNAIILNVFSSQVVSFTHFIFVKLNETNSTWMHLITTCNASMLIEKRE